MAGDKRKGVKAIACDLCYRRKIKCDGAKPACETCFKSRQPCTFSRGEQEKPADSNPPSFHSQLPQLGTSIEFEHLMTAFGELHLPDWRSIKNEASRPNPTRFGVSNALRSKLVQVFVESISSMGTWPHIPTSFILAESETSPLLFNAICAVGSMLANEEILESQDRFQLASLFHQNACGSIFSEIDNQTPITVLALVLLFIYCREAQMAVAAMNYRSMAIGMALDMKLNLMPPPALNEKMHLANCIRINIWWLVYIEDQWTSVLMGIKPLINDSQCRIGLSISVERFDWEFYKSQPNNELLESGIMSSNTSFVPNIKNVHDQGRYILLLKNFSLISRFSKKVKEAKGVYTPEMLYEEAILTSSLKEWHSNIPKICPLRNTIKCAFTNLTYFTCWITLYSGRIVSSLVKDVSSGLNSDEFKMCIEAAQNITQIISGFMLENVNFVGIPRYVCHAIYLSGIIHALMLKVCRLDATSSAMTQTLFSINLMALERLSALSLPCNLYHKLLLKQQMQLLPSNMVFASATLINPTSDFFSKSEELIESIFPEESLNVQV